MPIIRKVILIICMSILSTIIAISINQNVSGLDQVVFLLTLCPTIGYIFYSISKKSINILHPFFLYPLCYFLIFGVGITLNAADEKSFNGEISVILGLSGYLTAFFIGYVIKNKKNNIFSRKNTEINLQTSLKFEKIIFFIGIMSYCYYIFKIGMLPIFMGNLEQARVDASIAGGANIRILTYFLIVSSIIGFFNYIYFKTFKKIIVKSSLLVFISGILALITLGNRSPVFSIVYTSILIYFHIKLKGQISVKKFLVFSLLVFIGLIGFVGGIGAYRVINTKAFYSFPEYSVYITKNNYIGLAWFLFKHYLGIGYYNFSRVLDLFPEHISFKFGSTYAEPLLTILPGTQYTLDMQIKQALGQDYLGGGTIPSALGEAYANFGFIGCFMIPFITFFILNIIYNFLLKESDNPIRIIFYVYFLGYFTYNLLAGYAATSIFPFVAIGLYLMYRIALNSSRKLAVS